MSIAMSSFCGINRICKIASFTGDGLVRALLKLEKAINENAISATLKKLRQGGARKLQMLLLTKNARWLEVSGLESITLDAVQLPSQFVATSKGQPKDKNILTGVKPNWSRLNSFCLNAGAKIGSKKNPFGFLSLNKR